MTDMELLTKDYDYVSTQRLISAITSELYSDVQFSYEIMIRHFHNVLAIVFA